MSDYQSEARAILSELYKPEGVEIWLNSRNRMFNGERPLELIRAGRGAEVVQMLGAIRDGAFL